GVDTVDRLAHQHDLAADLQRALGGRRVGGEVRHAHAATEDHHAALFQVPHRAPGNVGLGDLAHRDRGLHPGVDTVFALQKVLQRKAVHHRAEHAHVVRTGPVHTALFQFGATEEVPAADHHGHLHAAAHHVRDLSRDRLHYVRVDADRAATEHFPAELEQHPAVTNRGKNVAVRRYRLDLLFCCGHGPLLAHFAWSPGMHLTLHVAEHDEAGPPRRTQLRG